MLIITLKAVKIQKTAPTFSYLEKTIYTKVKNKLTITPSRMKNIIALLITILFGVTNSKAQTEYIDSLKQIIITAKQDTNKVNTLNLLADQYLNANLNNNLDTSLIYAEQSLELAIQIRYKAGEANANMFIGIIHYYNNEFDNALKYFQQSLSINKVLNHKTSSASCLNNMAVINISVGNYSTAIEYFLQALELNRELGDKQEIAMNLGNLGTTYSELSNKPKAIHYFLQALRMNEELNNKQLVAQNLDGLGCSYKGQEAIDYYLQAIKLFEEIKQFRDLALSYSNIASTYITLKQYDIALDYVNKSIKINNELDDKGGLQINLGNIGNIYAAKKKHRKALEYYLKALKVSEDLGLKKSIATNLNFVGNAYLELNQYNKAIGYINKSLKISKEINVLDKQREAYESLSNAYHKQNDYKKALKYKNLWIEINSSIFNTEKEKSIAEMKTLYETEKKEKQIKKQQIELKNSQLEIAKEKAEKEKQQIVLYIFIFGFILLSIFLIMIFRLYKQKREDNILLEKQQKDLIKGKKRIDNLYKDVTNSINYAKKIQEALLPSKKALTKHFPEHFILFKPKDIVSGDFYYFKKINNKLIIAVADCTGHGVPGAFVSMLGIAFLNEIIRKTELSNASQILEDLRIQVKTSLNQTDAKTITYDGMDIALCVIDTKTNKLQYSGAYNPLFIIRNSELIQIKATRNPIGCYINEKAFENNEVQLHKDDMLYIFSDGYADQLGEEKHKKFNIKRLRNLLLEIHKEKVNEQKIFLDKTIEKWKGNCEQIDDISILGIKHKF